MREKQSRDDLGHSLVDTFIDRFSISAAPPGQEKTDHRKRSRRRTRNNYQMVIRKECYSDEIPYRTIQGVLL